MDLPNSLLKLRTRIESVFSEGVSYTYEGTFHWYYKYFPDLIENNEFRSEAIQLYIDTMIRLYPESMVKKIQMYPVFGLTYYTPPYYSCSNNLVLIKKETETKIKHGIINLLIKSQCILLLEYINDLAID